MQGVDARLVPVTEADRWVSEFRTTWTDPTSDPLQTPAAAVGDPLAVDGEPSTDPTAMPVESVPPTPVPIPAPAGPTPDRPEETSRRKRPAAVDRRGPLTRIAGVPLSAHAAAGLFVVIVFFEPHSPRTVGLISTGLGLLFALAARAADSTAKRWLAALLLLVSVAFLCGTAAVLYSDWPWG